MINRRKRLSFITLLALFFALVSNFWIPKAQAGNFTLAAMRLDRMKISVATGSGTNILVVVKPATVGTEIQIKLAFASGFAVASGASAITTSTASLPATYNGASLTAYPSLAASATASGQNVTFTGADLTVGTQYGFFITAGITNPSSPGQYVNTLTTQASGPTTVDSSDVVTTIISDDQIIVNATVPPTFTFVLSGNSDNFATNLSTTGVVSTAGRTVTITTNANNGWIAWVKSLRAGLQSATTGAGNKINTAGSIDGAPTTLTPGANGYVLDVDLTTDATNGTGAVTLDPEYNGTGTCAPSSAACAGGTLSTSYQPIASASGTTDGDVVTLTERATITGYQPSASDYTDTLTVVGAANF